MARASVRTLLSLDRWAALVGYHPLHFNQVHVHDLAPATTCGDPVLQYSWQQADRVGREEIAQAILDAETLIAEHAGFYPAPAWTRAENIMGIRTRDPGLVSWGWDVRGGHGVYKTRWGHVISAGAETWTRLVQGAAIVYVDADGDGYDETASLTVATTVVDPDEIALVYPDADPATWEIRPITVSIVGGNATITWRREQLVHPVHLDALQANGVDGLIDANFLAVIDVYRHWNDPSVAATMLWEVGGCDAPVATFEAAIGAMHTRNPEQGLVAVQPAVWNVATSDWSATDTPLCIGRAPDRIMLSYRSGWRRDGGSMIRMDPLWERAVAYYALSLLDRPLCNCDQIKAFSDYWSIDLAESITGGQSFRTTRGTLECPLGTTRGALHAWRYIRQHMVVGTANA